MTNVQSTSYETAIRFVVSAKTKERADIHMKNN